MKTWRSKFSDYMLDLRESNNLTQKEIASLLDVSEDTIYNIERGTTKSPYSKLLEKLAEFTNKKEYEVFRDITFYEADPINDSCYFLSLYASWYANSGYSIMYYDFPNDYSLDRYLPGCSLYEKKRPNRIYLILSPSRFLNSDSDLVDLLAMVQRTINYYETSPVSGLFRSDNFLKQLIQKNEKPAKLYDVQVVFDYNNEKEKEMYERLASQSQMTGISYRFSLVMFDALTDQYKGVRSINREY